MDDEDDPVVEEIDVFLSKQLASQLYLIQYPLRPVYRPFTNRVVEFARCKPQQQKLELSLELDTQSNNYARSKGEQFAINVDGAASGEDKRVFNSDRMDKHTIHSTALGPDSDRFAVACFRDRELHLTPLKGIMQLKPMFNYLDAADKGKDEAAQEAEAPEEMEPEAKPIMMKFARHETDEAKARRMASYEYLRKTGEAEAWVTLQHYEETSSLAEAQRGLLLAPSESNEGTEFQVSQVEYLERLMPSMEQAAKERVALPNNVLSMSDLKAMSLGDQVRALLLNAKTMRFSQLMTLLGKATDATQALRCVQQVALLVQGCWVVKSEVLYPKDACSPHTGVPAEALCRGRDYIMWRFTQSRCQVRKEISSVVKLPADDVKAILEQMARLKVNCGWEFLLDYDSEFVHRHPEVVQRQHMLWEAKFKQLSSVLSISKADLKIAAHAAANVSLSPKRRRTASTRSRTKSGGISDDPSDSEGERFAQRSVLSMQDLRLQLNMHLAECPPGHVLGSGVSDKRLEKAVRAIGGINFQTKSPDGDAIFGITVFGDGFDAVRECMVAMLDVKGTIKTNVLKRKLDEAGVQVPDEADLKKLLKEMCVSRAGMWHLKGSISQPNS
ncbi:hypothetical protein CAPTEDRAFT_186672 [Capitella teleta]|uniref:DNA-directed RNA polymerase III subunit RPC5 C-terminal domain-containing protein n=1 Tax=Capitella teleta TaxID=283909 RepID=R7TYA7_CAPTE|nr:hypothetical protein CAPTEDRAFT_186672 [Capitella teleta]|eukprot:ELT95950.1 hypothetical protein CAPTEDRAFT_186672 [Capitella teleta]